MSAGTELDKGALAHGLLVPRRRPSSAPARSKEWYSHAAKEVRSQYPIALLARDHDTVCTQAVDSAEIAASLEACGLNDHLVRERYRVGNVFELSRRLYELVPRRESAPPLPSDPWRLPMARHLGRGVLYALPMLPYAAVLRLLHVSTPVIVALLLGNVASMSITQGVSHLAYILKGGGASGAAARFLRRALVCTAATACVLALVAAATRTMPRGAVLVASAQLVYVVAATVLLVFDRDRLLLMSLAPVAVLSALAITLPTAVIGTGLLATLACTSLVAVVVVSALAWKTISSVTRGTANERRIRLGLRDVRGALLHALYGGLTAGLLMYAVLDIVTSSGHGSVNTVIGIGMLPLAASLGVAEMQLCGFRSGCASLLQRLDELPAFRRRMRHMLASRGLAYALVLAVLTAAVLLPAARAHDLTTVSTLHHLGYGELGIGLLGATILVSCQMTGRATLILAVALGCDLAMRGVVHNVVTLLFVHLAVFAALAVAVWATAAVQLGSPFRHR